MEQRKNSLAVAGSKNYRTAYAITPSTRAASVVAISRARSEKRQPSLSVHAAIASAWEQDRKPVGTEDQNVVSKSQDAEAERTMA
jgi:hypothetical protein